MNPQRIITNSFLSTPLHVSTSLIVFASVARSLVVEPDSLLLFPDAQCNNAILYAS